MQTGGAKPPLLLGPALGLAAVDIIPQSLSDTKSAAVSHLNPPAVSAISPAHTDTMFTTTLFSHIAGILNTRVGMSARVRTLQRVANAPPKFPECYKGNVVPESVWDSRGSSPLTYGLSTRPLCAR